MPEGTDAKPRRLLEDMRKLSEEIKSKRPAQKETGDAPGSNAREAVAEALLKRAMSRKK